MGKIFIHAVLAGAIALLVATMVNKLGGSDFLSGWVAGIIFERIYRTWNKRLEKKTKHLNYESNN